jgi:acyl-ACP thioesterase
MSELTKSTNHKFFYGSCDPNGAVKLNKLADVFAQLADEQVDEIKIRYPFLNNSRYRWILVRYHMEIRRMLFAEEPLSILTYQSQYTKYMCLRDYTVTDSSGKEPIFAQCQWVLVDQETGHIVSVPREYESLTETEKYRGSQFPKLSDISAKVSSSMPIKRAGMTMITTDM